MLRYIATVLKIKNLNLLVQIKFFNLFLHDLWEKITEQSLLVLGRRTGANHEDCGHLHYLHYLETVIINNKNIYKKYIL